MSQGVKLSFSHVGLFVTDLEKMVDFYTRHIGLVVSDREKRADGSEIAFMTGDPREHHQVVFASGRPADLQYNMIQQISFRAQSLSALREVYSKLLKEPIVELGPVTHGNAISCYFAIRRETGSRYSSTCLGMYHNHSAFRSKWAVGRGAPVLCRRQRALPRRLHLTGGMERWYREETSTGRCAIASLQSLVAPPPGTVRVVQK